MENQNLFIPDTWDKVSLGTGMKVLYTDSLTGLTEDEYFIKQSDNFNIDFENISLEERKQVKKKIHSLLSIPLPTDFNTEFIISGKRYLFNKDLDKENWALFRDKNMMMERNENNFWLTADLILALLIRQAKIKRKNILSKPQIKISKYNYSSVEERAELFKRTLSITDIHGVAVFFYLIIKTYLKLITTSSLKNLQTDLQTSEQKNLVEIMAGLNGRLT